ncbi:NAD(P)-dependent oxidoreductase [Lacrimispora sp. JR3]|uniref:NAD(P)-dependent oxidoreductase n=1 Tax=Lacrimispora sinapis TaxID=3111456 RepID=UPI003747AE41
MKLMIIGASGKQGSQLLLEAQRRGHEVAAVVRDKNKLPNTDCKIIEKDLFDLTFDDLRDYEVIISAFGTWNEDTLLHKRVVTHLTDLLSGKSNRLLFVGGAGSLYVDSSHTKRLMDTPDFPKEYYPTASKMALALDELRTHEDVNWTYLSPASFFDDKGERTGKYRLGGEEYFTNDKGESYISYADYAIAMIDEAEKGNHIKQRISVIS